MALFPFGKYEVLEEIGRGGFGIVYRAVDTTLRRRPVALKVLAPHLLFDPQVVSRFKQEAGLAATLQHPNIVTIYEVGEVEGKHFLAMQLIEGVSLAEILKETGALPVYRVVDLLKQLADALDYAHAQGVVHRDIKPSNILIDKDDHITLTDFGLAYAAESSGLTSSGQMLGTPTYISPEQLDAVHVHPGDARSDIYSLGIVVYEMLAGRPPFMGKTPAVVTAHLQTLPLPLTKFSAATPRAISHVVLKALVKEPSERYAHAGEFADAFIAALDKRSIPKQTPDIPAWGWALGGAGTLLIMGLLLWVMLPLIIPPPAQTPAPTIVPATRLAEATLASITVPPQTIIATTAPTATQTARIVIVTFTPSPTPLPTETPRVTPSPFPRAGEMRLFAPDDAPMMYVPPGEFAMGSDSGRSNEKPLHSVFLDAYWMDRFEVTNRLYATCVYARRCLRPRSDSLKTVSDYFVNVNYKEFPVVYVDWDQAKTYCEWANKRLPTEAEWEKAARGTDGRTYPWGNLYDEKLFNVLAGTAAVGSYPNGASPYGVMDLAGNVFEWVADWYSEGYGSSAPERNPTGPVSGQSRTIRGVGYSTYSVSYPDMIGTNMMQASPASTRHSNTPSYSSTLVGFRCARSP